jgi:8-hydroxy-5-deazaflavin:NADPH oxidoreductase
VAARPIAIIGGAGAEGFGLALRWAQAGETVIIGSRDAARAQQAAEKIKQRVAKGNVSGMENSPAAAASDLIVLTIPFAAHVSTLKELKPAIRPGSIVVDTTVPLAAAVGGRATRTLGVWQGSAAQQAAEILGKEIHVAAAFHHVGSELLISDGPAGEKVDCDVIVCSDDPAAIKTVRLLAAKIPGVRSLDGGKLENARILEQITALLIGLNIRHKGHAGIRITGLPPEAYQ